MASIIVRSARIALVKGNIANLRVSVDRSLATAGGPGAGVVANAAVTAQGVSIVLPQITLYTTWDAPDQTTREAQYKAELVDSLGRVVTTLDSLNPFQLRIPNSQTTWKEITEWNEFYRASQNQTPPDAPGQYDSDPLQLPMNNIFLGLQSNSATDTIGLYVGNNDNPPGLRHNVATGVWEFSSDGTTWTAFGSGGGGTPAGPTNAVQYNMGGVFGGNAAFTVDSANGVLALNGSGINPGQLRLFGTNGNFWNYAANQPAANRTIYWPDPLPTAGQALIAATVGATIALGWSKLITCAATQVLVGSATDQATGSNNFVWAAGSLTTTANLDNASGVLAQNLSNTGLAEVNFTASASAISGQFGATSANFTQVGLRRSNQVYLAANPGVSQFVIEAKDGATPILFGIGGSELARFTSTGLGVGTNSPTTKLDVSAAVDDSGLRLRGMGNSTSPGTSTHYLGYDPTTGKVIRATTPGGGGGGAPTTAQYLLGAADGALPNGLVIGVGAGITETIGAGSYTTAFDVSNSFNPTIAGTYTFNRGNTPSNAVIFDTNAPGAGVIRESAFMTWRARMNDGSAHDVQFRAMAGAGSTDGQAGYWRLRQSIDSGAFSDVFRVEQGGIITVGQLSTLAQLPSITDVRLLGRSAGSAGVPQEISIGSNLTLSGGTLSAAGSIGGSIAANQVAVGSGSNTIGGSAALTFTSGSLVLTSNNAAAFVIGANGATNPVWQVDAATASVATGLKATGAAAGAGVTLAAISSGANENFNLAAKGTGTINSAFLVKFSAGLWSHLGNDNGVVIGNGAGAFTPASDSVRIGFAANGSTTTSSASGVFVGRHAGAFAVGDNSVMVGHAAGQYAYDANAAVQIGHLAGRNPTQNAAHRTFSSVIVGYEAVTNGLNNQSAVFIGAQAGRECTNGENAFIAGFQAGYNATNATSATLIGAYAGYNSTNAVYSILIGKRAGFNLNRNSSLVIESNPTYSDAGTTGLIYGEFDNRRLRFNGNVGIFTSTFGTSMAGGFALLNGTAPTTYPADTVQLVAKDFAAGDSRWYFYSESGALPVVIGNNAVITGRQVTAKTANYSVSTGESNTFFTNSGAAGSVTFTLPPLAVGGFTYEFVRDANQTVIIQADPGQTIKIGSSTTSLGGSVTLDAVGSRIRLVAVSASLWYGDQTGAATFA